MDEAKLKEALAEYAHNAWSGWMKYMFEKGNFVQRPSIGGNLTATETVYVMPAWAVERWTRQMNTAYADLTEEEKASDRKEADEMIALFFANFPSLQELEALSTHAGMSGMDTEDFDRWITMLKEEVTPLWQKMGYDEESVKQNELD